MGQDVPAPPAANIDNEMLKATDHFIYLAFTNTSNQWLDNGKQCALLKLLV